MIDLRNVRIALDRALQYLVRQQNPDGSIACANDERFKQWETAQAILALAEEAGRWDLTIQKAATFLTDVRRKDGSFAHSTRPAMQDDLTNYCMETTSVATLALYLVGRPVGTSVEFILSHQLPNGSWDIGIKGVRPEIRCFASISGFALRTLIWIGIKGEMIHRGIQYTNRCQLPDGLWGELQEAYDSCYYAAHAVLAAWHLHAPAGTEQYRRAVVRTRCDQKPCGSWGMSLPNRPSTELKTALALNTLSLAPSSFETEALMRGFSWLLSRQQADGSWCGGFFGVHEPNKQEDLFATAMVAQGLRRLQDWLESEKPIAVPGSVE